MPMRDIMEFSGCIGLLIGALTFILNVIFAVGVYDVAARESRQRRLWFAGPGVWALATLFGGVFVAAAFWLIHLSTLSDLPPDQGVAS